MKTPAVFYLCLCIFLFVSFLFIPYKVFASEVLFSDDFTTLNTSNWNIIQNPNGDVQSSNSTMILSALDGRYFPYVQLKNVIIPEQDYSIEIRYKFSGDLNYGNGIILSDTLLQNGISNGISSQDIIFQTWPLSPSTHGTWTSLCQVNTACVLGAYSKFKELVSSEWHVMKITEKNDHYSISIDGDIYETTDSSRKISEIWIGNPQTTNTVVRWASIHLDHITISDESEETVNPIVIIPGMGGSWDISALMHQSPGSSWSLPTFNDQFESLTKSLENSGYVVGTDLFIWPYDWRKPLNETATDLKLFLESSGLNSKKIDFIGHSMGGLVARIYAQKYGLENVNKIITVGSPHLGSTDTYGIWEGAEYWKDDFKIKAGVTIASHVKPSLLTATEAIHLYIPSLKDVLPLYDFLSFDGIMKPFLALNQRNDYLLEKNTTSSSINDHVTVINGTGQSTLNIVKVQQPSLMDKYFGLWEDGKPIADNPFVYGDGDDTVLNTSAIGGFSMIKSFLGGHYLLPASQFGIEKIFEALGLDTSNIEILPTNPKLLSRRIYLVMLKSPGKLEVCDVAINKCDGNLGIYYPDEKLFMLPDYQGQDLRVRVIENGSTGGYQLQMANIEKKANWTDVDGAIVSSGQIDEYVVIEGSLFPYKKEHCFKNSFLRYTETHFRNQGACVSYVEKNQNGAKK